MPHSITHDIISQIATRLEEAELNHKDLPKITDDFPDLTMADATAVNWEIRRRKLARGHKAIGMKMGFTSNAMRAQM